MDSSEKPATAGTQDKDQHEHKHATCKMIFVSFNIKMTGFTSAAGTADPSGTP